MRAYPLIALLCPLLIGLCRARGQTCGEWSEQQKQEAAMFLQRQFGFDSSSSLYVIEIGAVPDSCYTRIKVAIRETEQPIAQTFYVSPDHRFFSLDFFDLKLLSPEVEKATQKRLRKELTNSVIPLRGQKDAPVLLSVFSDFECPFCREEYQKVWGEIMPQYRGRVALAFHQLPLGKHPWAMEAARVSVCIHGQGEERFWAISDWLFRNQAELTSDKIRLEAFYRPGIDPERLQKCLDDDKESSEVIRHDAGLASDLFVTSTPTMFVNGRRVVGDVSSTTLRRMIEEALSVKRAGTTD